MTAIWGFSGCLQRADGHTTMSAQTCVLLETPQNLPGPLGDERHLCLGHCIFFVTPLGCGAGLRQHCLQCPSRTPAHGGTFSTGNILLLLPPSTFNSTCVLPGRHSSWWRQTSPCPGHPRPRSLWVHRGAMVALEFNQGPVAAQIFP